MSWFRREKPNLVKVAASGNLDAVVAYLDEGRRPDDCGDEPITPLWIAAANGHEKVVQVLLRAGANANTADPKKGVTALMISAMRGRADVVLTLLQRGADPNAETEDGETALMYAVKGLPMDPRLRETSVRLQHAIIMALLTFGADPNKRTKSGRTVLGERMLISNEETKQLIKGFLRA